VDGEVELADAPRPLEAPKLAVSLVCGCEAQHEVHYARELQARRGHFPQRRALLRHRRGHACALCGCVACAPARAPPARALRVRWGRCGAARALRGRVRAQACSVRAARRTATGGCENTAKGVSIDRCNSFASGSSQLNDSRVAACMAKGLRAAQEEGRGPYAGWPKAHDRWRPAFNKRRRVSRMREELQAQRAAARVSRQAAAISERGRLALTLRSRRGLHASWALGGGSWGSVRTELPVKSSPSP